MEAQDSAPWRIAGASVTGLLARAAEATPDRIYCKSGDVTLSYRAMAGAVQGLARELGPEARGRVIGIVLPNSAAFLVAYFAILEAGGAPALVNYAHPDATARKLLERQDPLAVLTDRDLPGLPVRTYSDASVDTGAAPGPWADAAPGAVGAMMFSGGTTGLPKTVSHTQTVLLRKAERMEWGWPTREAEVWLPVAPFTHVYGFLTGVLAPLLKSGSVVIPPRFHPDLIVEMLAGEAVTIFGGGPPAIYQAIMASGAFAAARFPALRVCPGGGAPFPLAVHDRWSAATGLPITEGYGMTEIAPISVNTELAGMKPGAAGKPVPDTRIEIVDIQSGTEVLPVGEAGEIRVAGPHLMTGYDGDPEETAIALRGGWLYTGDIGYLDADGFLTISDRKKDVIFVKGFNVFPREIEEALIAHPAVSGACVVGRADDRAGEVPVAYVTLRAEVETSDLSAHCAQTLAAYKMPALIAVLDSLPMTPAAKVDRAALRAAANEAQQ